MITIKTIAMASAIMMTFSEVALAESPGNWVVRGGLGTVVPKDNNGTLAASFRSRIDNDTRPIINVEYLFNDHWGLAVLGALPFEHSFRLNGTSSGSFKHLPPTVTVQYRPLNGTIQPFAGAGVNYTFVFDETTRGPVAGSKLRLADSWGPAAVLGVDFELSPRWLVTLDTYWINIQSNARLNGQKIGTVHVDPLVYGMSVGYRF